MGHGARMGFGGNDNEAKQHLDWTIARLRTLPYTFELADPPRWAGEVGRTEEIIPLHV